MPVYDDQQEKTAVEDDELRRITGIGRGEEDAMETNARKGAEADAANNIIGGGYASEGSGKSSRFTRFTSKFNRRKVLGSGAVAAIAAGVAFAAVTISGPSQFVHISELLQSFHFGNNESFMEDRDRNIVTYLRNYADGEQHRNNLGYSANKLADHYERRLADVGIKPIYEHNGRGTGRIQALEVDSTTPQGEKLLQEAERQGIDIGDSVDGKHTVSVRGNGGTKRARTLISGSINALEDMGKINSAMAKWLLKARADVNLHVLRNTAREKGQDLLDYYDARRKARAEERAKGSTDVDDKIKVAEAEETTDADGSSSVDNAAKEAAEEGADIVGEVDALELVDSDFATKLAQIKNSMLLKGAGSAAAVVGVMCTVRSIGNEAENIQYAKVILPMIRVGMEFVSVGSQVKSGIDVNSEELGSLAADLYDTSKDIPENARSFWSAKSIQAEQGRPQTGADLEEALQPGQIEGQPIWLATLNGIPGLSTACGISDTISGLPVIKQVGDVTNTVVGYATAGTLDKLLELVLGVLAGDAEVANAKGAALGNIANYGSLMAANDSAISMGGTALSTAQVGELDRNRIAAERQELQSKDLYTRIFDLNEKGSLASKTLLESPELAQPSSSVASAVKMPFRALGTLAHTFSSFLTPRLGAQEEPYSYGIPEYGFSQADIDNPLYEDPFANADIVEPKLDYLNETYGSCFGTTITKSNTGPKIETKETVKYSATDKCKPENVPAGDKELVTRYRFYIADVIAMATMQCYELNESCAELGFDGTSPSSSSSNTELVTGNTTNIACDPRTVDKGEADGYKNKQLVKIRLCEVPNLPGGVVNSQVSGRTFDMVAAAQAAGFALTASESFRTMDQQEYFWNCYQTKSCNNGNEAAEPGTSNHQMGLAIDFRCNGASMAYGSPCYQWLQTHAPEYGFAGTVQGEPWHWSTSGN